MNLLENKRLIDGIKNQQYIDLESAVKRNDVNKIKSIVSSEDFKLHCDIHYNNDYFFKIAICNNFATSIIYFVEDYQIECSKKLHDWFIKNNYIKTLDLLNARKESIDYKKQIIKELEQLVTSSENLIQLKTSFYLQNQLHSFTTVGNKEMMKFIIQSDLLSKIHVEIQNPNIHFNDDKLFKSMCESNHMETLKVLIFDFKIEKTKTIAEYIELSGLKELNALFEKRDLNEDLNASLPLVEHDNEKRRNKI